MLNKVVHIVITGLRSTKLAFLNHYAFYIRENTIQNHAIKKYGGVEVQLQAFFNAALYGGEWSVSEPWEFGSRYSLERRLGVGGSRSGPGDKRNFCTRKNLTPILWSSSS
jgi:hypothetical protein